MSNKQIISTPKAPQPIAPYSQAIKVGNFVFLSGQIGLVPSTLELIKGGFEAELKQTFQNLTEVVKAADCALADIIKLTIYLVDLKDFQAVNDHMKALFKEPYPARTTIQVAALPKGALIEIEAIVSV
jgi:reactive intermediate/imine deaminase